MATNSTPVEGILRGSWHSFHICFSKVDIGQKKYSAEKIEAHSLLKITQLSNQPVIINATF